MPGIKAARGDLILAGALVIDGVMEAGGFDDFEATEAGLREGVFFERLLPGRAVERRAPRRRAQPRRPVRHRLRPLRARRPARPGDLGRARAPHGLHRGDAEERELVWATAMLHDIGVAVDYDDHHKHSRYLILNAGLPASRRERPR